MSEPNELERLLRLRNFGPQYFPEVFRLLRESQLAVAEPAEQPVAIELEVRRLIGDLSGETRSQRAAAEIDPARQPIPDLVPLTDFEPGKYRLEIRLTDKEASILKYLFRAGDRPVARDVLLNEVWGYNAGVTTHTLETHIYRLRQKIEKDPAQAAILITDRGGYRLQP